MIRRWMALLTALLILASAGAEGAAPKEGILAFKAIQSGAKDVQDWIAGGLPELMGKGGEWYLIGLSQTGQHDLSACREALLTYLKNNTVRSATTRQKLALTLLAAGGGTADGTSVLADTLGKQGVMSWAWGLHLLNNGCGNGETTADAAVEALLSLRKADGGWAVTGSASDVDATAMVLQALAPHREQSEVAAAVDGALTLLSARQLADGGFASFGVTCAESAAQVIIALCELGIDPAGDPHFVKDGTSVLEALMAYRLPDGSFSHTPGGAYSESATAQAFLALSAYERWQAGAGGIFLLDSPAQPAAAGLQWSYKAVAAAVIGGMATLACVVLLLAGKRHPKNFLAVAILAALLCAVVLLTGFQSAEEYYSAAVTKRDAVGTVTLSIRCDAAAGQAAHIPADGVLLADAVMPIAEGDTVYTVLTDAAQAYGLHLEASGANGLMYVHGIGNIYEFDFGDLSGWVFLVNGESSSVGCDQVLLRDGDRVAWHYTLALGKDIE